MAYTVRNNSKETYLFNIPHDDNIQRVFSLMPGQYVVADKIGEDYFVSDSAKQSLIQDIFGASGEGRLSVKDGNGADVSYSDYKTANA